MMKRVKSFNIGDKVFAKVKGYPAWPAKIIAANGKKYEVSFYGTMETGSIKVEDLFYYIKHKDQFFRNLKRKDYQEAVEQIEAEIKDAGTDGNNDENADASVVPGDSVEKKGKKRKRESIDDAQSNKIHRGISEDFETQESEEKSDEITNSQDVDVKISSQSVTRSGRVIKLKKFSDEEDEEVNKKSTKTKKAHTEDENADKDAISTNEQTERTTEEGFPKEDVHEDPPFGTVTKPEVASPVKEIEEKEDNETQKEEEEDIVDVNTVSIDYLEAVIAYAEHVKSKASVYKKKTVEVREILENEVVIAKLPSNKLIGIKYNKSTHTCDNEYEKAIEDAQEAKRILSIKSKLENGYIAPESEKDYLIMNLKIDEESLQQKNELKVIERKKTKLKYLKTEASLVDYDCKIKSCLGLDKADPKKAYEYMDSMMELDISPLMLKKHPLIVDVMKRLRRYIGNVKEWKLAGDSLEIFEADAEKIRQKAEEVFSKFISLFMVTDATSFWDVFNTEVEKFEEETKDMNESELFALCAEPNSRQAFFDNYDDKKDAENTDNDKVTPEEKEKENSSDVANTVQAIEVQENNLETP